MTKYYMKGIKRTCKNECRKEVKPEDREEYNRCVESCIENKIEKARELSRHIKWYESKLNFITRNSLRIYDVFLGLYVICYVTRKQRMVCMAWDPGKLLFRFKVEELHACVHTYAQYCSRPDPTRNLHVESTSCETIHVSDLPPDLNKAVEYLMDSFHDAEADVYACLECFGEMMGMEELSYGYSLYHQEICAYNRCDKRWHICDPNDCTCIKLYLIPFIMDPDTAIVVDVK